MANISYTKNGYTVESFRNDTSSATKARVTLPDIDFANDYAVISREPNEAIFANITGDEAAVNAERVRTQIGTVKDMYAGSEIPKAVKADYVSGNRAYIQLLERYKVTAPDGSVCYIQPGLTNSVTIPNAPFIDIDIIVDDMCDRMAGMLLDPTSSYRKVLKEMLQGFVLPAGLR